MPSLRLLLTAHAPVLLIDAASSHMHVGWLGSDATARWESSSEEAGIGIFRCLEALGSDVSSARAFGFCEGPGSILGIRTVAMALRTWCMLMPRPVFAYSSLALVAHALDRPELGIIADGRRESWHLHQLGAGLRRVTTAELSGDLVMPENFRHWTPLPPRVTRVPYAPADLLPRVLDADLFRRNATPDAFLHEEPSYVTWTPQIHRAPPGR
jgi:tRNA threonylcarbamoyladenosine biosynthesis protein TsaB